MAQSGYFQGFSKDKKEDGGREPGKGLEINSEASSSLFSIKKPGIIISQNKRASTTPKQQQRKNVIYSIQINFFFPSLSRFSLLVVFFFSGKMRSGREFDTIYVKKELRRRKSHFFSGVSQLPFATIISFVAFPLHCYASYRLPHIEFGITFFSSLLFFWIIQLSLKLTFSQETRISLSGIVFDDLSMSHDYVVLSEFPFLRWIFFSQCYVVYRENLNAEEKTSLDSVNIIGFEKFCWVCVWLHHREILWKVWRNSIKYSSLGPINSKLELLQLSILISWISLFNF